MADAENSGNLHDDAAKTGAPHPLDFDETSRTAERTSDSGNSDWFTAAFGSEAQVQPIASNTTEAPPQASKHSDPVDALDAFVSTMRKNKPPGDTVSHANIAAKLDVASNPTATSVSAPNFTADRPSRRVPHRKSFKLTEAPSRAAVDELELEIKAAAAAPSPTRNVTCTAMQIRPSAVSDSAPRRVYCGDEPFRKDLPDPLPAPMALRCDFCIKFNSVCSNCHFKWKKEHLKKRVEKLMAYIAVQPETTRIMVFLSSVAKGDLDFVAAFLDAFPDALHWSGRFHDLGSDVFVESTPSEKSLSHAGRVFPLHIAIACDRVDIAKHLISKGAPFRRTEKGVSPLELLPREVPERWSTMLEAVDSFKVHTLCEQCKDLRRDQQWEEAEVIYRRALEIMPNSEHAHCGLAKMAFDAGDFLTCVQRCDAILKAQNEIAWGQFIPNTIETLRTHAMERLHEEAHPQRGAVLRRCGCIILDHTRISIRKLPFDILRKHVLPFMDCILTADLHRATKKMPLLTRTLSDHAAALHPEMVKMWLVSGKSGERLLDDVKRDLPTADHVKWEPPVTWKTFSVFAVADLNAILITNYVEVANAKAKKKESVFSFGKKKDAEPKTLWLSKHIQLSRGRLDEPWVLNSAGEWEVCPPLVPPSNATTPGASPGASPSKGQ